MEEVVEQTVAMLGEDRLRVELNSVHRVLRVLNAHDLPVFRRGSHSQLIRQRARRDDERVIPRRHEGAGQPLEEASP